MRVLIVSTACVAVVGAASAASAQSFGIDDNPQFPLTGPPGIGLGAEDPYGFILIPGLAPSPTLGTLPCIDAEILAPGPVLHLFSPNGAYIDALSDNTPDPGTNIRLRFSVDRMTFGAPATAVSVQAGLSQQPGDVFMSTDYFMAPGTFVPTPPPPVPGYAGPLFAWLPGPNPPSNTLIYDDSSLGLVCGGLIVPANMPAPPIVHGSHDNVDSFDRHIFDLTGDLLPDGWIYFTIYPDEAMAVGTSAADIYDVAPNNPGTAPVPYAPALAMGLDLFGPNTDSIDGLVVYDHGQPGGPNWGGPGGEPGLDYALFTLAPGSASLAQWGLSAGDVFLTDYQGSFYLYALAPEIGLIPFPGGEPGLDNADSLDPVFAPCPWDCADNDGVVGILDFLALLAQWGNNPGPCDVDGDGAVGILDFLGLLGSWGPCP